MKAIFATLVIFSFSFLANAQKNVIAAKSIPALGLSIPEGSRQDKRFLSTISAATLLETEVNDPNISLSEVEVYRLPPAAQSGFDGNFLIENLENSGFQIIPTEDERMAWILKEGSSYLIYFYMEKEGADFYIAKSKGIPKPQNQSEPVQSPISSSDNSGSAAYIPPLPPSRSPSNTSSITSNPQPQIPIQSPSQNYPAPVSGSFSGFQFTSSNFDDGVISTIQSDWVLVQKGETKVYLFFVLPYRSENFSGTGVMDRDYYWDNHVGPIFKTTSKGYQDGGEFVSSMQPKYVEGWGQDPETGQRRFLGMYLTVSPNAAMLTIASASDEAGLRQNFPKAADRWSSDLVGMSRYNKFAIGTNDITGTWQSGGSQMTQWYDSFTGAYAGATIASSSATFSFTGPAYSSIHNGATGAVGAMNTFQQEYKGSLSVSSWTISLTNRYQGKTQQFDSHFQAVKGGRLLYLNNQAGEEYLLVKIK